MTARELVEFAVLHDKALDKILDNIRYGVRGCWLWQGPKTFGYGKIYSNGRMWRVHRLWYSAYKKVLKPTEYLDHLCRRRNCVNPEHLRIATPKENVLGGNGPTAKHAKKKKCKRGHPLSMDNLASHEWKTYGWRKCKKCSQIRQAQYKAEGRGKYA